MGMQGRAKSQENPINNLAPYGCIGYSKKFFNDLKYKIK